jgi:hypothetical protein
VCWKCHKPGHTKKDGPERTRDAAVFGAVFLSDGDMQPRLDEYAILDTGASDHTCNDKRMLTELSAVDIDL